MTKRMMRALAAGLLVCMLAGSAAATNWDDNYDPFVELPPETSEQAEQTERGTDDGGAAVFRRGGDGLVLFRRDAAGGGPERSTASRTGRSARRTP